jgi:hypothetical protein
MPTTKRTKKIEAPQSPESFESSGARVEQERSVPTQAEALSSLELGVEHDREGQGVRDSEQGIGNRDQGMGATPVSGVAEAPVQKDRLSREIESVLEEDLTDMYLAMTPTQQTKFKVKGEEVREKVRSLVSEARVSAKKIFLLIREWIKMIPGVDAFFLEQEAKIKTDKILLVSHEELKRGEDGL